MTGKYELAGGVRNTLQWFEIPVGRAFYTRDNKGNMLVYLKVAHQLSLRLRDAAPMQANDLSGTAYELLPPGTTITFTT